MMLGEKKSLQCFNDELTPSYTFFLSAPGAYTFQTPVLLDVAKVAAAQALDLRFLTQIHK